MISQTVEYALRAIVALAQNQEIACTSQKISQLTQVPAPYLSKLMQVLVRGGLVQSQRGLHGGFVLAKPPGELTIWDVLNVVEPFKRIRECPLGLSTHGTNLCPLHRRLDIAMENAERAFRDTTIAELLSGEGAATPLCDTQPTARSWIRPAPLWRCCANTSTRKIIVCFPWRTRRLPGRISSNGSIRSKMLMSVDKCAARGSSSVRRKKPPNTAPTPGRRADYASTSSTTWPWTSVSRRSMPLW